jgi:hypothetical protein
MEGFRIEPPLERSSEEADLIDDLFLRRAMNNVKHPLRELGYITEEYNVTTAIELKIFRAKISGTREGWPSYGVVLYWEYKTGDKDMTVHIL